jgi:hypothetical protein
MICDSANATRWRKLVGRRERLAEEVELDPEQL